MLGFSQLECCAGVRGKWFSRKGAAGNADCWPTTVEVPQHSLAEKRSCKLADDYKYNDGEIQIDRTGLRTLRNGSSRVGGSQKGAVWSEMLKASRQFPEDEDDCLSVASTLVGDDLSEASSVRSFRSSASRRAMDDFVSEVPMPSTRSLRSLDYSTKSKPTNRRHVRFENIRKVAVVGKGNSGVVWRCIDKSNCDPFALKEVPLDDDEEKTKMAVRELVTMYGVDHAGVVTCHEVFYSRGSFQMVLEFMDGGSLLDAMRRARDSTGGRGTGGLTARALGVIGRSVASALEMLHEVLEIVHRDVKPGNILLTSQGTVKLADLGICTPPGTVQDAVEPSITGEEAGCETPATEWIGTVTYMSPERLVGDPYSFKADIWSLGVVLVEAAVGRYPLNDTGGSMEFWDLLDRVLSGPCPSRFVKQLGPEWEGVARVAAACLDKDAVQRPRARELKECEVLRSGDANQLAEWVVEHMPELAGKGEEKGAPAVLCEDDMWA